jgi:hypothetical protein
MILALQPQPHPAEPAPLPVSQPELVQASARPPKEGAPGATGDRRRALLAGTLGFLCFMPYPALAVGNNSAVQIGNALTLLMCLPVFTVPWRQRAYWLYPLLLAPLALATLKVGLSRDGDVSLSFKSLVVWGLSCLTIVAAQLYVPDHSVEVLTGVAAAALLHFAVGLLQSYSFAYGLFPLAWLYVNRSFLGVQENAEIIARYTQRPFGLFPEPSAMSSSLAPWVVFWTAYLCGAVRLQREVGWKTRALFAAAAGAGIGLIILSRSGHAGVTLAAIVPFAAIWFARRRATAGSYLLVLAVCCFLLPIMLYFAAQALGTRVGGSRIGNSSWEDRLNSLSIGFSLMSEGNVAGLLCGMGPGLSSTAIQDKAGLEAVWSVLLPYVYETGVVGLFVVCGVGYYLLRLWVAQRCCMAFAAFAGVWLVGITITTSYNQLLPIWLALGWLTVWPEVCVPPRCRVIDVRSRNERIARDTAARLSSPATAMTAGATEVAGNPFRGANFDRRRC